jgi:superfamily I DNA/RNA helicase
MRSDRKFTRAAHIIKISSNSFKDATGTVPLNKNYPRTPCIIDCAETFIQRPTNLRSRGETYSNYKSHTTVKYLVGISPHGQIMFLSKAFGGRASDK